MGVGGELRQGKGDAYGMRSAGDGDLCNYLITNGLNDVDDRSCAKQEYRGKKDTMKREREDECAKTAF